MRYLFNYLIELKNAFLRGWEAGRNNEYVFQNRAIQETDQYITDALVRQRQANHLFN